MKTCTKCKENKLLTEFGKSKLGKNGFRAICKKCHSAQNSQWQKENIDKLRTKKRKQKEENPELISKKRAVYSMNRRKKRAIYETFWRNNNPGKANAKTARRRAARVKAIPPHQTKEEKFAIQALYIEAAKITKETGIPHEVDHIEPLQGEDVSGLHVLCNLRIIPMVLNRSKSNKRI